MKAGSLMLAAAIVIGGSTWTYNHNQAVPELVTYTDTDGTVAIEEEETPLAKATVTTSTKTKTSTKKIKMKTASKKTYTKKGKTKTKKKTSTKKTSAATTKTETVTQTSVTNQYKKGSNINTQLTTVKTTVTKTVTPVAQTTESNKTSSQASMGSSSAQGSNAQGAIEITKIAPKADSRVLNAYQKLGFKVVVNSSVSYSGLCDARTRTITLKKADATIYHELGHFVAFIAGNMDTSADFVNIFNSEKSKYTAFNKSYVLQNSAEYFAESFKNYTENPAALQASRPQTYAAIQTALSRITDAQITKLLTIYGAVWNA